MITASGETTPSGSPHAVNTGRSRLDSAGSSA